MTTEPIYYDTDGAELITSREGLIAEIERLKTIEAHLIADRDEWRRQFILLRDSQHAAPPASSTNERERLAEIANKYKEIALDAGDDVLMEFVHEVEDALRGKAEK